jgi:hypothetical protein
VVIYRVLAEHRAADAAAISDGENSCPHIKTAQRMEDSGMAEGFKWGEYRPSKAVWFWSCAGCVVATVIVGFTWGGWVTGGTAEEMVTDARDTGRAELAAVVCVDRFLDDTGVAVNFAELKEQSQWQRDDYIEDGGWTTLVGFDEPIEGAADLCATQLTEMESPVKADTASAETTGTAVN